MTTCEFSCSLLKALGINDISFGNNILLTGPAGVGKSTFCDNLTNECLREGINVVYAALDVAPNNIRTAIQLGRPEEINLKGLTFVDGYSWLLGEVNETHHVSHLSNLNDLSVRIYNAINEQGGKSHVLLFDSISTLFIYNSETEITRFMQINMARVKHSNGLGFWTVGEGIHAPAFYSFLRHMAEGIIEMRCEDSSELKHFMRIHTLKGVSHKTNWHLFTIQDNGILDIRTDGSNNAQ